MVHVEVIKIISRFTEQAKSIRAISRETGHHRKTVSKYVNGVALRYKRSVAYERPVSDAASPFVELWYTEDMRGPKKQRRTAQKMYNDLVTHYGYKGSYSTVKVLYRRMKDKTREVFVPRETRPGEYIEFDFGYIKVLYNGEEIELSMHCYQLIYSNDIFVYVSQSEKQESMFHSHKLAFEHFEGIPQKVRYDNLKQAVKRVLTGKLRDENDSFRTFKELFGFQAEFCERNKGWQKGDVEGLVGYVRRNYFSPMPTVTDLEEVNKDLSLWCKGLREKRKVFGTQKYVGEYYEVEKRQMQSLPSGKIEVGRHTAASANHYSLISVDSVFYSLPSEYAYQYVDVLITIKEIIVTFKKQEIAIHQRSFEKGRQIFEPLHYLPVYLEKPYTVINSKPIRQLPEVFSKFFEHAYHKGYGTVKECIKVLELLKEYTIDELALAVEMAMLHETYNPAGVKQILKQLTNNQSRVKRLDVPPNSRIEVNVPPVELERYNRLLQDKKGGNYNE